MSLTSALRPSALSFTPPNLSIYRRNSSSPTSYSIENSSNRPFNHEPDYINLNHMLGRYQFLILPTASSSTSSPLGGSEASLTSLSINDGTLEGLTPLQKQIQAELWSPLPFHRNKWLRNVEGARTLLLRLERVAQNIRVARVKTQMSKDLAEKRQIIKSLKRRIEEIGHKVESGVAQAWDDNIPHDDDDGIYGERIDEILKKQGRLHQAHSGQDRELDSDLSLGKPVTNIIQEKTNSEPSEDNARDQLLNTSSNLRLRGAKQAEITQNSSNVSGQNPEKGQTTGFSSSASTERALLDSSRTQESLTSSLVSMAAQLKQQSRAFQFSLEQDKSLLDRALEGLDKNLTGMEAASKNMAFLTRMSESEGFFGRLKLYALIFGLWVAAVLLVFVGPKFRF